MINFAVRTSLAFLQAYPDVLIVVGSYTIGKERLFQGMIVSDSTVTSEFF